MLNQNYRPNDLIRGRAQIGRAMLVAFIRGRLRQEESCKVLAILDRCPMWRDLIPDIYYGSTKTYQNALRHQRMGIGWREPISFCNSMRLEKRWKPLRFRPRMDNKLTIMEYCLYVEVGTEMIPNELFTDGEMLIYNRKVFLHQLQKLNLSRSNVFNLDVLLRLKSYHKNR